MVRYGQVWYGVWYGMVRYHTQCHTYHNMAPGTKIWWEYTNPTTQYLIMPYSDPILPETDDSGRRSMIEIWYIHTTSYHTTTIHHHNGCMPSRKEVYISNNWRCEIWRAFFVWRCLFTSSSEEQEAEKCTVHHHPSPHASKRRRVRYQEKVTKRRIVIPQ